ncbi:MAG: hypothetical protein M1836_007241 [Candelina mexicana]|nr:MAG: hypothetical protein M1836_007241 [Candelina mexicana]
MNKSRVHLFLDWDGTLTKQDTLAVVARIGYNNHQRNASPDSPQLLSWEQITESYMQDMQAHQKRYRPEAQERRSVADELAYLASLEDVERASVQRVEGARIFQGVTKAAIDSAAQEAVREGAVKLRLGWTDLVDKVRRRNGYMAIVSVNWSGEFIKRCMYWANNEHGTDHKHTQCMSDIKVCANEISGIGSDHGAPGRLSKGFSEINYEGTSGILTSEDKLRVLERLINEVNAGERREQLQGSTILYIGDSATDLACLCSDTIDVGICIRDEPMGAGQRGLAKILDRVGVKVRSIDEFEKKDRDPTPGTKELWWARDLDHISNSSLMRDMTP